VSRSHFCAAALVTVVASAAATSAQAGITEVDIGINPTFEQTGPSTIVSTGGFFSARAFVDSASDFDSGTISGPGPVLPQPLTAQPGPTMAYALGAATTSDLNTDFPFGTYTFNLKNSATSDNQTRNIAYSAAADSLSTPGLTGSSFTALQGMDAGSGFTFDLNPFLTNPLADTNLLFFSVSDGSGDSVFSQDDLDPSTTSIFMPGGMLIAGRSYSFDINFDERILGTDGDTPTEIFFDTHTDGAFSTAAPGVPEPASWSLMIAGFAGIGFALRRRRPLPFERSHG
jgi:PEP-CTERM motif-containing protein